jgi:hypothetical protein
VVGFAPASVAVGSWISSADRRSTLDMGFATGSGSDLYVRRRIGGFRRLSQQEGSDLLDRLREPESFAGSVVELGSYPVEVGGTVD